jgi:hypothetical protein
MSIAEREQQILRVKRKGFHKELDEALAHKLTTKVVSTVKTVLENALNEEVKAFLKLSKTTSVRVLQTRIKYAIWTDSRFGGSKTTSTKPRTRVANPAKI